MTHRPLMSLLTTSPVIVLLFVIFGFSLLTGLMAQIRIMPFTTIPTARHFRCVAERRSIWEVAAGLESSPLPCRGGGRLPGGAGSALSILWGGQVVICRVFLFSGGLLGWLVERGPVESEV